MKKLIFFFVLFTALSQAQENPYIVKHCEGTSTYFGDKPLICSNEMRSRWFAMVPSYIYEKGEISVEGFVTLKLDIGKCSKQDWIIITFSDGSKLTLRSSDKELSCENEIFFKTTPLDNQALALKTVNTIRYINGNDLKSFTYYLTSSQEAFFINAYNNFIVVKAYCK